MSALLCDPISLTFKGVLFNGTGYQVPEDLIRRGRLFLASIILIVFAGCAIIPTPEHGLIEGRGKINKSDITFLTVGKTTKEDVLLRFGEPDMVLQDQRILIYHWKVIHGYWIVAGPCPGCGDLGPISKDYSVMLEFDEQGRLKRFERSGSIWSATLDRVGKWTSLESKKPIRSNGLLRRDIFIDPIPSTCARTFAHDIKFRPTRFRVGEFLDSRASPRTGTFIGHVKFPYYVDIRTYRPADVMIRTAVTSQLQAMQNKLVIKDADVTITGNIKDFEVTTSWHYPKCVVSGALDVILEVQPPAGTNLKNIFRYKANVEHVSTNIFRWTYAPIEADDYEQIMRACLEEMQRQIASDTKLAKLLDRKTQ